MNKKKVINASLGLGLEIFEAITLPARLLTTMPLGYMRNYYSAYHQLVYYRNFPLSNFKLNEFYSLKELVDARKIGKNSSDKLLAKIQDLKEDGSTYKETGFSSKEIKKLVDFLVENNKSKLREKLLTQDKLKDTRTISLNPLKNFFSVRVTTILSLFKLEIKMLIDILFCPIKILFPACQGKYHAPTPKLTYGLKAIASLISGILVLAGMSGLGYGISAALSSILLPHIPFAATVAISVISAFIIGTTALHIVSSCISKNRKKSIIQQLEDKWTSKINALANKVVEVKNGLNFLEKFNHFAHGAKKNTAPADVQDNKPFTQSNFPENMSIVSVRRHYN